MASKSSSSTSSQTQANTTSTYNTTDQRQGVDGQGNLVAGAGANVTVTDNSEVIAQAALDASSATSAAALAANAQASQAAAGVASDALAAMVNSQAKSLDTVNRAVDANANVAGQAITASSRAIDSVGQTFTDLSAGQVSLLSNLIAKNAETTEAVQQQNANLASSFLDKTVTAISDSKTDTNAAIINNAVQYGSYAAIALAIALGLYALTRKK